MRLLNKIFKGPDRPAVDTATPTGTRFEESDDHDDDALERETSRRELVKLVLRESMRRHAVPSDWIDCRMLPVVTSKRKSGVHVQLIVKQGQGSLLNYIPAFQSSLMAEVEKFDARAWDWLLSISWQFAGITAQSAGTLPGGQDWRMAAAGSALAAGPDGGATSSHGSDDDVREDLAALFAIRDAAIDSTAASGGRFPDFEATQPGFLPPKDDR